MAGRQSKVLSEQAVQDIRRRYEEERVKGRRVNTHRSLGKEFGCSETTILRALNGDGAFMGAVAPKSSAELAQGAAASLSAVLERLKQPEEDK